MKKREMCSEEKIISFLDSHEKEIITFTQQLVRIKSENGSETAVAKAIAKKLRNYGIKSRLLGKDKNRRSLLASVGKGRKSLILNGHTDTVKVTDAKKWKHSPFAAKIVSGNMFGRGAHDMKSGLAAITFAAIALSKIKLKGKLLLACSSDEESGKSTGINYLLKKGLKADACIIAEPYYDEIGIGNRGALRLQLTARGKTGHTGNKKVTGINAVVKMAKVLLALQKTKFRFKEHKLFPKPKITPGVTIEGGTAINIVPGTCNALIDCRLSFGQTKKSALQDIKRVIKNLQKKDKKLKIKIEIIDYKPPVFTNPQEEIVKVCQRQAKKEYGFKPKLVVAGGGSDGNCFGSKMPYVLMGTEGWHAHTENEYTKTKTINKASKAIALSALEFLSESK